MFDLINFFSHFDSEIDLNPVRLLLMYIFLFHYMYAI